VNGISPNNSPRSRCRRLGLHEETQEKNVAATVRARTWRRWPQTRDLVITLASGPRGTRSASVDFGGISRIAVPRPGDAGVLLLGLPTMLASMGSAHDLAGHASLSW